MVEFITDRRFEVRPLQETQSSLSLVKKSGVIKLILIVKTFSGGNRENYD